MISEITVIGLQMMITTAHKVYNIQNKFPNATNGYSRENELQIQEQGGTDQIDSSKKTDILLGHLQEDVCIPF